jgi:hypothetical protein
MWRVVFLAMLAAGAAWADDFPIAGTYTQQVPCRGDGSDPEDLRVKITPSEITYADGVCALSDERRNGKQISVRAACQNPGGVTLTGDITFTMRDDKIVDMADQDNNYNFVLYRCSHS